jgi:hypothetical protein
MLVHSHIKMNSQSLTFISQLRTAFYPDIKAKLSETSTKYKNHLKSFTYSWGNIKSSCQILSDKKGYPLLIWSNIGRQPYSSFVLAWHLYGLFASTCFYKRTWFLLMWAFRTSCLDKCPFTVIKHWIFSSILVQRMQVITNTMFHLLLWIYQLSFLLDKWEVANTEI